jgi:hypothetical protein
LLSWRSFLSNMRRESTNTLKCARRSIDTSKVALNSAVNYICVDPIDGVKVCVCVWGGICRRD